MIRYLRSCIKYFVFAGIFSLFINTLYLTFPLYMLAVYSRVLTNASIPTLAAVTVLALVALTVLSCLDLVRSRLLVRAGVKLDVLLTRTVLKEMLTDLARADSIRYTRGLNDINTLRTYLGGNSIYAFFDFPWIFIYLGVIYLVHPVLGLTATGGAVVTLSFGLMQHFATKNSTEKSEAERRRGKQWLATAFRTSRELHAMGMITDACAGFERINDHEMNITAGTDWKSHLLTAASQSFGVLMQVVIFGVGACLVLAHKTGPGVIIAASIIMGRALAPVTQAIGAWKQTAQARTAYNNLKRMIQLSEKGKQDADPDFKPDLHAENLCLDIGDTRILEDINFYLKPGEIMGLIGPNGAGKTTLCRLILGMWAPSSGRMLLGGKEVFSLDSDSLGTYIGYLPQNVELFSGTVSDNIARMGDVVSEDIVKAAVKAGAHETILQFPEGYDTDIGEAGQSLSGGQRQRVGLARALFGNPRLVILDEPNANLDQAGEQALVRALDLLKAAGTTTIMITHKPELLYAADRILVLEAGRMVRFGSRDEVFGQMIGDDK